MAKEVYTGKLKVQIGRVQASAVVNHYFPVIGQTIKIDATTKWGKTSEWQTQSGDGNTDTTAGSLNLNKDSKELTLSAAGELVQKFIARNSLTETVVSKMVYAMHPQTLPYFGVTADEVVRVGANGTLIVMMENGYKGNSEIAVRLYKENQAVVHKVLESTGRPTPDYQYPFNYVFPEESERGIYDIEVDVKDTSSGVTFTKRINKLITVIPQLCPKPDDVTTGYEVVSTYNSLTTYSDGKGLTFELRLWRNVKNSGLNYAEAVLPSGNSSASYDRINVSLLPGNTTLCLKVDPQETDRYPFRLLVGGGVSAGVSAENGTPNFTFEKPLVITHDSTDIFNWYWISYGAINTADNMRNIVVDGYGYNNTLIKFDTFDNNLYHSSALFLVAGLSDFEIYGVDINGSGFAGISAKTDPNKDQPWYWRENGFEFKNLLIHHCTFENTEGEGVYIGYYSTGAITETNSAGVKVTYHPHILRDLRLYRCKFLNTGLDPVQINNSIGVEVCYLDIEKASFKKELNQSSVFSCTMDGKVYNCKVWDNYSMIGTIHPFESTLEIYNNILTCDKDSMGFSWTHWSESNKPETNDILEYKIYNNIIKARTIATVNGNISFSKYTMNDNIFITSTGDNTLPAIFTGSGNIFVQNNEAYDVLDAYLKVADSANYDYQPNYNSLLVSAGNSNLTEYDMRGYKRWYSKIYHCGPLMGIYKDESLPDASIQLLSILINNGTPSTLERNVSIALKYRGNPIKYRNGETND